VVYILCNVIDSFLSDAGQTLANLALVMMLRATRTKTPNQYPVQKFIKNI